MHVSRLTALKVILTPHPHPHPHPLRVRMVTHACVCSQVDFGITDAGAGNDSLWSAARHLNDTDWSALVERLRTLKARPLTCMACVTHARVLSGRLRHHQRWQRWRVECSAAPQRHCMACAGAASSHREGMTVHYRTITLMDCSCSQNMFNLSGACAGSDSLWSAARHTNVVQWYRTLNRLCALQATACDNVLMC